MDYSNYDVVWVLFIVYPKEEIVRKVISDFKSGGKVVYRNPSVAGGLEELVIVL